MEPILIAETHSDIVFPLVTLPWKTHRRALAKMQLVKVEMLQATRVGDCFN